MEQYILKSALVAEIERRIKGIIDCHADKYEGYAGEIYGLRRILDFLDTLEVKEVDLEKEIDSYIETTLTGTNPIYTKGGVSCIIEKTAKHFFELGLKTQKKENKL